VLNIRQFTKHAAGMYFTGCNLRHDHTATCGYPAPHGGYVAAPAEAGGAGTASKASPRVTTIGGKRVKVIDVHGHIALEAAIDVVKGTKLEKVITQQAKSRQNLPVGEKRIEDMDRFGIEVSAMSINPLWYELEREVAAKLIDVQNHKLSEVCNACPDRFTAYATVSLQFPELAVKQVEHAIRNLGLCGVAVGTSVGETELADRKFDEFWAKCEELQCLVFIHPLRNAPYIRTPRLEGNGGLPVAVGHPYETTITLTHLIFQGTLDKFPNLKICAAHGGGYLPSYPSRIDNVGDVFPKQVGNPPLKKQPSEYLKQMYFDTLVFTSENIRHLAAVCGASQLVVGTDYPTPWVKDPITPVLECPGLTDADKFAILGGTAAKLLKRNA
jgi:aminocarboxymuconate-semialdehyde decarboxylase